MADYYTKGRLTKWIRTKEDWHGTFTPLCKPLNPDYHNPLDAYVVRVSFMQLTDGNWRVCVWGNDDFGLEYDTPSGVKARIIFESIGDYTTQYELHQLGFINA